MKREIMKREINAESLKENMDIFGGYFDRIDPY